MPADAGARERRAGHLHRAVPGVPQRRGEHRGSRPAAGRDHGLPARAMASRGRPDAFATALTGVYATDPGYGSSLIALMRLYNLYRYDAATAPAAPPGAAAPRARPAGRDAAAAPPARRSAEPRVAGRRAVVPGIPDAAGSAAGTAFRGGRRTGGRRGAGAPGPKRAGERASGRPEAGAAGRGSRRGVRCRRRAATSRGFRTRSPLTSRRRPRDR